MGNKDKSRYEYIDALKGVAILCITLLHFEEGVFPEWLNVWIGRFMISAFYLVAGWLYGIRDTHISPRELFRKRLRQLGWPYLWFTLLILAFDALWTLSGFMDVKMVLRDVYKSIVLRGIGTLWFLPVLLFGEWLFCVVRNSRQKWITALFALAVTLGVSYIYNTIWCPLRDTDDLHRILDAPMHPVVWSLNAWPVIGLGFLLGRYIGPALMHPQRLLTGFAGVLLVAFSLLLTVAPPFHIFYINDILTNIVPSLGLICIFVALGSGLFTRFFSYWGRNSLILMCTHFSITEEILKVFDSRVLHHEAFSGQITLVYFAVTLLLTWMIIPVFNNKLRFMLGK